MGHLHGRRQRMITPDATRTIASYLLDHPHLYCNSDAMLATSLVSGDITDALSQSYRFEQDNVGWKILLHRLEHDLRQWQEDWLGDHGAASALSRGSFALTVSSQPLYLCNRSRGPLSDFTR